MSQNFPAKFEMVSGAIRLSAQSLEAKTVEIEFDENFAVFTSCIPFLREFCANLPELLPELSEIGCID